METIYPHDFYYYVDTVWKRELHKQFKDQWFYAGEDNDYGSDDTILQIVQQRWESYSPKVVNPLAYLEWFCKNGIKLFIDYFKHAPEIKYGSALINIQFQTNISYKLSVRDLNYPGRSKQVYIEFNNELENLFKQQRAKASSVISCYFDQINDPSTTASYLLNVKGRIDQLRFENLPETFIYQDSFLNALSHFKNELRDQIQNLLGDLGHADLIPEAHNLTPKERERLLIEIYHMGISDRSFIDQDLTDSETFLRFFSRNRKPNDFLYINCKGNEAAVVLDHIKNLGFNIVFDELEANKSIKSSPEKFLSASYISKAISKSKKENSPTTLPEINAFFHDLEGRYFYNKR